MDEQTPLLFQCKIEEESFFALRSLPMSRVQIFIPEAEFSHMLTLVGRHSLLHVVDLAPTSAINERSGYEGVRMCKEALERISYLAKKASVSFECEVDSLFQPEAVCESIEHAEHAVSNLLEEKEQLRHSLVHVEHQLALLLQIMRLCEQHQQALPLQSLVIALLPSERTVQVQKVVFDLLRGNCLIQSFASDSFPEKDVFVVYVHGSGLKSRIVTIVAAFGGIMLEQCFLSEVSAGKNYSSIRFQGASIRKQIEALEIQIEAEFSKLRLQLPGWYQCMQRALAIYEVLGKTLPIGDEKSVTKVRVLEGWCPTTRLQLLGHLVDSGSGGSSSISVVDSPAHILPPTLIQTNKFTAVFQELCESYSIPEYQEINPAIPSIVSFPFLFGVMFGDVGHGILLIFGGFILCVAPKAAIQKSDLVKLFWSGRFLIVLMGVFGTVTGFFYSDCFSLHVSLFRPSWEVNRLGEMTHTSNYPIGIDPIWLKSTNGMSFINGYKMKQAILLGLLQMFFGLWLNACNKWRKGDALGFYLEVIPQLLILASIFGYLGALIVLKWLIPLPDSRRNPSLLNTVIGMVLWPCKFEERDRLFAGQHSVQVLLLGIFVLSSIVLFVGKPIAILAKNQSYPATANRRAATVEIFVIQAVHTIEYVLGCVSNTASYLRLWALSLAHAQLSQVIWKLIIASTVRANVFMRVAAWIAWFFLTVNLLVLLEGVSAFLHTLRLHWVEFNGKFFHGEGYRFQGFEFISSQAS